MKRIKKLLALLLIICVFAGIGHFVDDEENGKSTEPTILQEDTAKDRNEQDSDELDVELNEISTYEDFEEEAVLNIKDSDIAAESSFEIHYIDVGQADASLSLLKVFSVG